MLSNIKHLSIMAFLCISLGSPILANAKGLTASVDRDVVNISDSFTLQIEAVDTSSAAAPDFSVLNKDFAIIDLNVNQNYLNTNGVSSQTIVWDIQLQAKRVGQLVIPSFQYDAVNSDAITINVKKAVVSVNSGFDYVLEVTTNKTEVKVKEQILVTIKLLFAEYASDLRTSEFVIEGTQTIRLKDKSYETTINGRQFGVYELNYAVFAAKTGELTIPVQQVSLRTSRQNFLNNQTGNTIALQSKPVIVKVSGFNANEQPKSGALVVADSLILQEKWSADSNSITLGDSITREIDMQLSGALAGTIAPLKMLEIKGIKIYPEVADKSEEKTNSGLVTKRSRKFAIVPTATGTYTIPAVEIYWWDSVNKKIALATLAQKTIEVKAAVNSEGTAKKDFSGVNANNTENAQAVVTKNTIVEKIVIEKVEIENPINQWLIYLCIALFIVCITLSWLLFKLKNKPALIQKNEGKNHLANNNQQLEQVLFNELIEGIKNDSNSLIHTQLKRWAKHVQITVYQPESLQKSVELLERNLYANQGDVDTWDKAEFSLLIADYRKKLHEKAPLLDKSDKIVLAALYPDAIKKAS